jgi:superoxide dismutase, Fe-Mn family
METRDSINNHARTAVHRRDALATLGLGAMAGLSVGASAFAQNEKSSPIQPAQPPLSPEAMGWDPKSGQYVLPPLPYKYEDLEPHIDAETMHLHHDKHHKAYVEGLNKALASLAEIRSNKRDNSEIKHWTRELAFHGSGHFLHVLFWNCMGPASAGAGGAAKGAIAQRIDKDFGSFKNFDEQFKATAVGVEGSGWGILAVEPTSSQLLVMQAEKHQNLTAWGVIPLLACDVWEHAYYLKYKNVRKDYVAAFMNVINWSAVDRHYAQVTAMMNAAGK